MTNATLVFVGFFGHHGNHADTFNNIFAVLALIAEPVLADFSVFLSLGSVFDLSKKEPFWAFCQRTALFVKSEIYKQ